MKLAQEIEELCGVNVCELFKLGLLQPDAAKKWIVRNKYFAMNDGCRTYTEIKNELSSLYGISISSIEKLIYRDRCKYEKGRTMFQK